MRLSNIVTWFFGKQKTGPKTPSMSRPLSNGKTSTPVIVHEPISISNLEPKAASSTLSDAPNTSGYEQTSLVAPQPDLPAAPANEDASPSDSNPNGYNTQKYPKLELPRPLYALLIGIDKYQSHPSLNGAVKDANNVAEFLMGCMAVAESRITKLLDEAATAGAIVKEMRSLASSPTIEHGDAILIYFAGHGARAAAPEGWETPDGRIETICPVDMSTDERGSPGVSGIPDVVLNALITELADRKGDNITVIFDCCHSASGMRGKNGVVNIRGINDPPPISSDWERILQSEGTNSSRINELRSLDCCVLLAACGRSQEAGESEQGGLFTQALLENIGKMSSDELRKLTYKDLIRTLAISDRQHPQCEGSKSHRYLFREETANQSFISGYKENEGNIVLDAGEAPGITVGTEFDIYSKDSLSPDNPSCGRLIVKSASQEHSILSFVDGREFEVPHKFFAIQAGFLEESKLKVYCSDSKRLNEALWLYEREFSSFATLVNERVKADLVASFSNCTNGRGDQKPSGSDHQTICFDWGDHNVITQQSTARIGRPICINNPEKMVQVFQAAARFHYYLYHGEDDARNEYINVAFYLLRTENVKIHGMWIRRRTPSGKNLLEDGQAEIQLETDKAVGPFGLTVSNYTNRELFPQVFWFEGRDLTIKPWYTNQYGAGETRQIDAPLRARHSPEQPGEFHVGHGEVHNKAWGFSYDGEGKTVGFFKVLLATFNVDCEFLAQNSPFSGVDGRRAVRRKFEDVDWWTSRRATVVQLAP